MSNCTNSGPATVSVVANNPFSEDEGTINCCVEISGLPVGGLGCDIIVELLTADVGSENDASMLRKRQCRLL